MLEPYITPSLFEVFDDIPVDEYHYCQQLGKDECLDRLTQHWLSYYNESDFATMKQYGLNMVRVPIGYWSVLPMHGDPYVQGALEYLDQAIAWAQKYDLKVLIDLHGAPGSQNGFDNSGYRDIDHPGWLNTTANVNHTYNALNELYAIYGTGDMAEKYNDTIIGIQILNEPNGPFLDMDEVGNFYNQTYLDARNIMNFNILILLHDAFQELGYWDDFLSSGQNYYNIMIDHHRYEVFDPGALEMNISQHIASINSYLSGINDEYHPAIVGEWSAALTDCTPWLNGVGLGSRYEGQDPYNNDYIGNCSNVNNFDQWSELEIKNHRKYIEIQLDQYSSKSNGWIFWCWKTENAIEWDFQKLIELDLMPQPLNNFTYIKDGVDTDAHKSLAISQKVNYTWFGLSMVLYILFIA